MANPPIFYTPFTKSFRYMVNTQGSRCSPFESDYFECAKRIGNERAAGECRDLMEDWAECNKAVKQQARVTAMKKVRRYRKRPHIEGPPGEIIQITQDVA